MCMYLMLAFLGLLFGVMLTGPNDNVQVGNEWDDMPIELGAGVDTSELDSSEAVVEEPEGELAGIVENAVDVPNEAIQQDFEGMLGDDGEGENAVDAPNEMLLTPFGLEVIYEDVEGELGDDEEGENAVDAPNDVILTPFGLEVIREDVEGELADDEEEDEQ